MFPALPVVHKRETISGESVIKALPPLIPTPARKILHCARQLLRRLPVAVILNKETRGSDPLRRAEKTDLVEQLSAAGLEGVEEVGVGVGLDEGVADLRGDDETVLFHAGDAGGFLDGGRRKAFPNEGGNERSVLVPEAEAVGEDVDAASDVEGAVLRREGFRRRAKGLVDLLLGRRLGVLEGRRVDYGRYGFDGMATVGEGWRSYEKEMIGITGFEGVSVCSDRRREGEHVGECLHSSDCSLTLSHSTL